MCKALLVLSILLGAALWAVVGTADLVREGFVSSSSRTDQVCLLENLGFCLLVTFIVCMLSATVLFFRNKP